LSFTVRHCRVRISYWFFVLLAGAALPLTGRAFFCGIIAAFIHEAGHLAAMSFSSSMRVTALLVSPFGLRISSHATGSSPLQWRLVCFAGAAANVIAAVLCRLSLLIPATNHPIVADMLSANLALAALNMAPVQPLDGGQLMHAFLCDWLGDNANRVAFAVSLVFSVPLMTAGFYILLRSGCNFSLLLIGIWLFINSICRYCAGSDIT